MSGQTQQRRGFHDGTSSVSNSNDISSTSADPWKVLVKKLDTTKGDGDKARFGKVTSEFTSNKNNDNVPNEMQCVHFGQCAGCNLRGNFAEAPIVTRAKIFFKTEGVDMAVHLGKHHGYRTHVKLAVGPQSRWGGLNVGLYREGSHQIEPIPDCRVHHPAINECVEFIKEAAKEVGVRGYRPADRRQKRADRGRGADRVKVVGSGTGRAEGELRYIQLSLEEHTGKVQVTLVWNSADFKGAGQNLPRLVKRLRQRPELVHSVTANFQAAETNTIFNFKPRAWKLLWGPPVLKQQVGDATFFFKPQIFRQANLGVFADGIIPQVVLNIPPGAAVAELYSGIGIMGLNAANKASEVLCSDSNEYVTDVFDSCVTSLPNKEDHDKVFYEALSAEEAIVEGQCDDAEVVLVDPPRKGLDTGVMKMLIGTHSVVKTPANLKRLIYVSCGFEALERDTRELLASNKWRLRCADGYVIFPGSNHIETVAVFDFVGGQGHGEREGEVEEEGGRLQQRSWEDRPSQRR
jgi:tRNA/tmRNA/rRNA uracil-C5-methylase (TrmA/RlmC/RlmD family)